MYRLATSIAPENERRQFGKWTPPSVSGMRCKHRYRYITVKISQSDFRDDVRLTLRVLTYTHRLQRCFHAAAVKK